jgi:hypothetical protein
MGKARVDVHTSWPLLLAVIGLGLFLLNRRTLAGWIIGGIGKLGHTLGGAQVGDFHPLEAGQNELLQYPELGIGGDGLLLMLQPVSRCDFAQDNFCSLLKNFISEWQNLHSCVISGIEWQWPTIPNL